MAKNLSIDFAEGEGSLMLTLCSRSQSDEYPRTALLTVRGKDNCMTAAELEKLGKACLRYAADIRKDPNPAR
jgi:hypothetical protein